MTKTIIVSCNGCGVADSFTSDSVADVGVTCDRFCSNVNCISKTATIIRIAD